MCGHSGSPPFKHWQMMEEDSFVDNEMLHEVHSSTEQNAHNKGVHKTWLQSQRTSHVKWGEDVDVDVEVENMALIHQKFMEAKLMSTDERLRQSKQFKDALEVLTSNSDLLISLLDPQNLYQLRSMPPLAETKEKKTSGKGKKKKKKNDELIRTPENVDQPAVWGKNKNLGYSQGNQKVVEALVKSTRIVVLKPSSGKPQELKTLFSPTTSSSPRNLQSGKFYQGPEDDDDVLLDSRKVAKEITQQVRESLYPSVISNCYYSGDESSFSNSYHGYKDGNFTDFEAMSPTHSWEDHINHCGSLCSTLSLGGAICSPESSVCIEAKKRLYERWTMMESNSKCPQEQMQVRRASTTLGQMLSLSHKKKSLTSEFEGIDEEYQEPSSKSVSFSHSFNEEMSIHGFPKKLLPIMSNETGLKVEACDHDDDAGKAHDGSKAVTKSKGMKSSFKGKVSSFLFSRKMKSTKEKSISPSQTKDESQCSVLKDDFPQSFNGSGFQGCSLPALCESFGKTSSDSVPNRQQQGIITLEPGLIVSKAEISSENKDQPSPISVLEPPFEDDNHGSLDCMKSGHHGSLVPLKSNLIDKSPPIETIARTLSWGDSCGDASSSLDSKLLEEQQWLLFVEKLLSEAGLDDQIQNDPLHTRWHSLESPLDPSLRDKYANLNEKEHKHLSEFKRRKLRSNQKLVFDCLNAALLELASGHCGPDNKKYLKRKVQSGGHIMAQPVQEGACALSVDHIVEQMKELIMDSGRVRCVGGDCGDNNSLVLENFVRKEVVGIGWVELKELEIDILGREIERALIQELVESAVVDFTGRA